MSQLRTHLKFTICHRIRAILAFFKLGYIGKNVYISNNVEFVRFPKNISIKDQVVLKEGAKLCACNKLATIKISERTTIGYFTYIFSSEKIEIGRDCLIAPFVYIVDSDHRLAKNELINRQTNETAPIKIGNDVWIASNVIILKGVQIADGAVIAANSVVKNNIGAYEIWGGSPAKKIGDRQ